MNPKKKAVLLVAAGLALVVGTAITTTVVIREMLSNAVVDVNIAVNGTPYSPPVYPKCADVFVVGKTLDFTGISFTCARPDGSAVQLTGWYCTNGKHLHTADRIDGVAQPGWGFTGEPFQGAKTSKAYEDPGYGEAFDRCRM